MRECVFVRDIAGNSILACFQSIFLGNQIKTMKSTTSSTASTLSTTITMTSTMLQGTRDGLTHRPLLQSVVPSISSIFFIELRSNFFMEHFC